MASECTSSLSVTLPRKALRKGVVYVDSALAWVQSCSQGNERCHCCLEYIKFYCKYALFYSILLYIAIFRNVTPTVKENLTGFLYNVHIFSRGRKTERCSGYWHTHLIIVLLNALPGTWECSTKRDIEVWWVFLQYNQTIFLQETFASSHEHKQFCA